MKKPSIAILGCVGIPAKYGGFETLAENLAKFSEKNNLNVNLSIYCSSPFYKKKILSIFNSKLIYLPIHANGVQSILYDGVSLFHAILKKPDKILLLGVSGAIFLPVIQRLSNCQIIVNVDGIEWKREKWKGFAKKFLKFSEVCAMKNANTIIADNEEIKNYLVKNYNRKVNVITYGGDHALDIGTATTPPTCDQNEKLISSLPNHFSLGLCRIEPENNIKMILKAYASLPKNNLVFVGNWNNSEYGKNLQKKYNNYRNLTLINPIYDTVSLFKLRKRARSYVHGHSAGGTNPSLVEMMHFGIPIYAFDCKFNRATTMETTKYFKTNLDLQNIIVETKESEKKKIGKAMKKLAVENYTWDLIGKAYFALLL